MLIINATVTTWGSRPAILRDQALYIEDGIIRAMGPTETLQAQYSEAETLDARGQLVMPGNICAHTHFYGAYARGMAIPGAPPPDFPTILKRLWWGLDRALDRDAVYASAMVCLVDAIKHGTTTLIDHHASPNAIDRSLDVIGNAVNRTGLRAILCYEVSDRDGEASTRAGIAENARFIETSQERRRVSALFGLHASMTLSDATLRACRDAVPEGTGFHIHVAEHEADQEDSVQKYGKRVVHRLHEYGILGERSIAAHCIHIDESELSLLRETNTWVTHQPRSNMNNGVGAMAFDRMYRSGVRLCLGNDGFSNNMWAEWKTAYLLHKVIQRDPRAANGADLARVAVDNNARLVEQFFPGMRFGEVNPGAVADLIFVDYQPFTPLDSGNLPWHILFGFEASMVTTTIVDGVVLMHDRQLTRLDEKAVIEQARALAPAVWERYQSIVAGE